MDVNWSLETRKIKDLKENPKNPRRMSKDQALHLEVSISKFGLCEPVVINQDGLIIGGHQRVRTLKKMGKKEVDVYVPHEMLDDKKADELNIRLNKNSGDFDFDILANNWDAEELIEWGFTPEELHLDLLDCDEPEEKEKSGKSNMHITFLSAEHLQDAENQISAIVDKYQGATYKIKI
jgi:ParB-like chromosome segregation protein Spo0J